jgi:hypothetical protein
MRCCQNKTSFSWSYRDSSKRSLENNVISRWGKRKIHTIWDRWTCANGKEWSRGTKEVLLIRLHMVGKMSLDLLNLETLKFLMHFRELGSSLYFIFTHSYFFSYIYIFSFFLFLIFLLSLFFLINFFNLLPFWTLKLHCTYLHPMLRRLLVLEQRGDRDKVGTGNTFPLERHLKFSILAPSCNLPWIDDPFSTIGCGQGGNHKRWYLF